MSAPTIPATPVGCRDISASLEGTPLLSETAIDALGITSSESEYWRVWLLVPGANEEAWLSQRGHTPAEGTDPSSEMGLMLTAGVTNVLDFRADHLLNIDAYNADGDSVKILVSAARLIA